MLVYSHSPVQSIWNFLLKPKLIFLNFNWDNSIETQQWHENSATSSSISNVHMCSVYLLCAIDIKYLSICQCLNWRMHLWGIFKGNYLLRSACDMVLETVQMKHLIVVIMQSHIPVSSHNYHEYVGDPPTTISTPTQPSADASPPDNLLFLIVFTLFHCCMFLWLSSWLLIWIPTDD